MKFASREGATARTLAVTAPGWYGSASMAGRSHTAVRQGGAHERMNGNGGSGGSSQTGLSTISRSSTMSFSRGQQVFRPGQGAEFIYIVRSGVVRLYKSLPDGRSINLGLLGPGSVFTQELDPDGLSSGSTAEALVDASVSTVSADDLATLIQRSPELAASVVHGMSRRLSEMHILTEHLLARDTSVRLASTLLALARGFGRPTADGLTAITLPITHQSLANMIGSNRVTVTRKLLELQEQGAVRSLGRNSLAVSPERLLAHAQAAGAPETAGGGQGVSGRNRGDLER